MAKKLDLILDVGSGSIGACILEASEEKPALSFVKRFPIGSGSPESRANIAGLATEMVKTVLKEFQTSAIGNVYVVLASPWYSAKIATVATKAEKPVKVSHATVARTVQNYRAKQGGPALSPGRTHIESVVTQVSVNGYPTALEKTVLGTSLKVTLYESEADAAFIKTLTDAVHGIFPNARISFHSFPLLAFVVLRDFRDEESFVFADAGGEVTDVGIVFRDSLSFLGSFPRGSASLMRDVMDPQKGLADASSRISLFVREELSVDERTAFAPVFEKAAHAWQEEYEKILESARTEVPVPQTTFVAADKEELAWFGRILESNPAGLPARAIPLSPDFFHGGITLGDSALYDTFLSLEAIFFHTNGPHRRKTLVEV